MAVKSLQEAQDKLIANVRGKGRKYDSKTGIMAQHWSEGLSRLGVTPGAVTRTAYTNGIQGKGSKLEENAITGASKWAANYKAGMEI